MSGPVSTAAAAPPAAAPPAAAPPTSAPPTASDPAHSQESFTEILSAQQTATAPTPGQGQHRSSDERDEPAGPKAAPAKGSPSSSVPPAPGATLPAVITPSPTSAVVVPLPPGEAKGASSASPRSGVVAVVETTGPATAAAAVSGSVVAVATSADAVVVPKGRPAGPTDEATPDAAPAAPGETGAASAPVASEGPDVVLTASETPRVASSPAAASGSIHGSGLAGSLAAEARVMPKATEQPSPASGTPPLTVLPRFTSESVLAQSGAPHSAEAVERLGVVVTSPTSSSTQSTADALDVDGLSGSISRPLSDGNGTYTVTVALHPPELGHLQAVMSLDGNDLQVSLTAQTQAGHEALANATEALKDQLARGGVNVNVTLRDPGSQSGGDEQYRPPTSSGTSAFVVDAVTPGTLLPSATVAGQIHLVL
jgi:flagellar hook-length control protein FliK